MNQDIFNHFGHDCFKQLGRGCYRNPWLIDWSFFSMFSVANKLNNAFTWPTSVDMADRVAIGNNELLYCCLKIIVLWPKLAYVLSEGELFQREILRWGVCRLWRRCAQKRRWWIQEHYFGPRMLLACFYMLNKWRVAQKHIALYYWLNCCSFTLTSAKKKTFWLHHLLYAFTHLWSISHPRISTLKPRFWKLWFQKK